MRKSNTLLSILYLYPIFCQLTSLSEKYKNIMDGFKMQNNEFWRHYFIDVLSSRVIIFAEHIFIMKTIQVEETVSASNTIFWINIHVNGVKCFKS